MGRIVSHCNCENPVESLAVVRSSAVYKKPLPEDGELVLISQSSTARWAAPHVLYLV